MHDWSALQYLKFVNQRNRPACDLINAVKLFCQSDVSINNILDIGCGPGNSTALLQQYWPKAKISGLDSSSDMIKKAQKILPDIEFKIEEIENCHVSQDVDLLFSNAAFQWLPDHITHIQRFIGEMKNGGLLAIQIPDNLHEPIHQAMIELAQIPKFKSRIGDVARKKLPEIGVYYDAFSTLVSKVDIWHSIYYHVLDSHEAIVDWVKGAGLRPFISQLNDSEQELFLNLYLEKIKNKYPLQKDTKVLLPFPRLFILIEK